MMIMWKRVFVVTAVAAAMVGGCGAPPDDDVGGVGTEPPGERVVETVSQSLQTATCVVWSATFIAVSGAVTVRRSDGVSFRAQVGSKLFLGDTASSGAGASFRLKFVDGSERDFGAVIFKLEKKCRCAFLLSSHDMRSPIEVQVPSGCLLTYVKSTSGSFTFQTGAQPYQTCNSTKPVAFPSYNTGCNGDLSLGIKDNGQRYFCDFDRGLYNDNATTSGGCKFQFYLRSF